MNPFIRPWRHLFDFRGRASRREYGLFHISVLLLYPAVTFLTLLGFVFAFRQFGSPNDPGQIVGLAMLGETGLFLLVLLIGHVSVSIRRLHDQNERWTAWLYTLIPIFGLVQWARLAFVPGSDGENDYGPDPQLPVPVPVEALGDVFA